MSKPRYNWWPFAINMIRDYPVRHRDLEDIRQQKTTADLSGMPRGGGASRTAEGIALRQLPDAQAQREHDAVHNAIQRTGRMRDSKLRLEVIKLTLWKGYTISGAAMIVNVAEHTARRYRWQFILLVGCMYGFMTEEEYQIAVKLDMTSKKMGSQSQESVVI